jgi:hypothetical protein
VSFLRRLLGYRSRTYSSDDFSVQIKSLKREGVLVTYVRDGTRLDITGERTGRKWEAVQLSIPKEVEMGQIAQIASDLETAFQAMDYEYDITSGLQTLARSKGLWAR